MSRVIGVDVARGLAILGMFAAHLGSDADTQLWNDSSWLEAADGRSAATFALLAGVSAGFISGGPAPATGTRRRHARIRILVRAAILLPLGIILSLLGAPVAVILPSYAVMFAMITIPLGWRPRALVATTGVVLLVAPPIVFLARDALPGISPAAGYPLTLLVGQFYPALVWIAYLLVGLALARLDLTRPELPWRLVAWGVPLAVVGYGVGAVAVRVVEPERTLVLAMLSAAPHADSAVELVGNIGVVLCLLAVCLLAARVPRLVYPVAATGALALTAYSGHIVAIAMLGPVVFDEPSNARLAAFILVTLAVTSAWRGWVGRGPLEVLLHRSSTGVADRLVTGGWGEPSPPPEQPEQPERPGQQERPPPARQLQPPSTG